MKIIRITTIPISLNLLISGQMKFMAESGFEVIMVSANGKEIKEVLKKENCPHHIIPFTRKISPLQDLYCLFLLTKLILKEKPNIIHTHTPKAGLLGMLAAKICRIKVKLHTVAGLPLMTASGLKKKLLIAIEKLTYWSADVVLPNSNSIRKYIITNNFLPERKVHIIGNGSSNGIDLKRFSKNQLIDNEIQKVKNSINYQKDAFYITSIGRIVKDKGVIELVNAFLKLKKDYPILKL
ncbi:MAG TPA: glycosyltransferase family 1 protein, partial [Bacteroidetes bacterium]|nr:glycosyltransferase family 1 protein [Bacteroidota bacterium]